MQNAKAILLRSLFALFLSSCTVEREPATAPNPEEEAVKNEEPAYEASDNDFLGLPLEESEALAEKRELIHRVISVDGDSRPATTDYRPNRVNFYVEDGKVTKVDRG